MSLSKAIELLRAGKWVEAHELVDDDESKLGCWAHAIAHFLEGDTSNARYWYERAGRTWPDTFDVQGEVQALSLEATAARSSSPLG
jgi:hypothetical protein